MQKLNLYQGGHPYQADDLGVLQAGIIDALKGVVNGLGGNNQSFILQGVVPGVLPGIYSAGYIYYNGEVYPVDARATALALGMGHAYYWQVEEVTITPSPVVYQDTASHIVHVRRRMKMVEAAAPPANSVLVSVVVRLNQILGITPKQGIIMYSGSATNFLTSGLGKTGTQLDGWALCNGGTFALPGGGTLAVPNLRGKFIVGFDETGILTDYNAIGNTGGETSHTLTKAELPTHKHGLSPDFHSVADGTNTPHANRLTLTGDANVDNGAFSVSPLASQHLSENGTIDGLTGAPHENRPPYFTLCYIIKLI